VSEPKRYGLSRETCDITEWRYGPYVAIEDYQKMESKCQRYKAEVERLTKINDSFKEWADFVRVAFNMSENMPPSISYIIQESIKTGKEPYFPPPTWSFDLETVKLIFEKLNKIQ
jgi:hypothetical protein